jgi:hypothetical protein
MHTSLSDAGQRGVNRIYKHTANVDDEEEVSERSNCGSHATGAYLTPLR